MKLEELDTLVGKPISTMRNRTAAEIAAWGPGEEGGEGIVESVSPIVETIELSYTDPRGRETKSKLVGRMVVFDWGVSWLVTEDTLIEDVPGLLTGEDIDAKARQ